MRKIISVCLMLICIANAGITASAASWDRALQRIEGYNATLYLSDWERGTLILKDVSPAGRGDEALIAGRSDYLEVPVSVAGIQTGTGERIDMERLNVEFLDERVYVILGQNFNGVYCVYMKILD